VQKPLKILVVRFSSIGDIIQSLSIIPKLKASSINYEIHWLTKSEFEDLVKLQSNIDCVWTLEKSKGLLGLLKLGAVLRKEKFDILYDAHLNIRSILLRIILFSSVNKIIVRSKNRIKRFLLFNFRIDKYPLPYKGMISFIKPLVQQNIIPDIKFIKSKLSFPVQIKKHINSLLRFNDFIVLAPSAAHEMKRWPVKYWHDLISKMPTKKFVILGGPDDQFCQHYEDDFQERVQNLAGKISLTESIYVIEKSQLVVSADSGMIHVADLINKAGIILLGPTAFGTPTSKSIKIMKIQMACSPCTKDGSGTCKLNAYKKCLTDISPQQVKDEIDLICSK